MLWGRDQTMKTINMSHWNLEICKNILHATSYNFNHCIKSVVPERSSAVPHQLLRNAEGELTKNRNVLFLWRANQWGLEKAGDAKATHTMTKAGQHHVGARFMKWKELKCFLNQMRYEHKEEVKTSSKSSLTSSGDGTVHTADSSWDKSLNWSPWSSWAAVWIFFFLTSASIVFTLLGFIKIWPIQSEK